jgi:hypothetical protein
VKLEVDFLVFYAKFRVLPHLHISLRISLWAVRLCTKRATSMHASGHLSGESKCGSHRVVLFLIF